jgi:hypothetical protein
MYNCIICEYYGYQVTPSPVGLISEIINIVILGSNLVETFGPKLLKPLVGVFRLIRQLDLALVLGDVIPRLIVQGVLFIGSVSDVIRNSLHVITNLLVTDARDIVDLSVLQAELITIVGVDLERGQYYSCAKTRMWLTHDAHAKTISGNNVLDGSVALGLVETVAAGLIKCPEALSVETGDVVLAA